MPPSAESILLRDLIDELRRLGADAHETRLRTAEVTVGRRGSLYGRSFAGPPRVRALAPELALRFDDDYRGATRHNPTDHIVPLPLERNR